METQIKNERSGWSKRRNTFLDWKFGMCCLHLLEWGRGQLGHATSWNQYRQISFVATVLFNINTRKILSYKEWFIGIYDIHIHL